MPAKENIRQSFRKLVGDLPYGKITIADICKKAYVSRAAFYIHYSDKNAIVEDIIEQDIIRPQEQVRQTLHTIELKSAPQLLGELIYKTIASHAAFYRKLNQVDKGELLRSALTKKIADGNKLIMADYDLTEDEFRYATFFFAAANAMLISHWIDNDFDIEPTRLGHFYTRFTLDYLRSVSPSRNWKR